MHVLLLLEDIHVFEDRTDESLARWLMWHTIAVNFRPFASYLFQYMYILFAFKYLSLFLYQATQLIHTLDVRLKELSEEAEWEKALKEVAAVTAKEKAQDVEIAEKKVAMSEKAKALAEERFSELEVKVGEKELKLAKAESLNLT